VEERPTLSDVFPLPVELSRLRVFLGNWVVEGTLTVINRTFPLKGVANFSSVAAGWGVLVTGKLEIEGLGFYEETDIMCFNRDERLYHFFAVTNTGAAYDHKGDWVNDNTLGFSYAGLQDGKSYREELEIIIYAPDQIAISERDFIDSQITTTMDVTLRKELY
jgi:hypothetical protein